METELYQTAPQPADKVTVNFQMEKGTHEKMEALANQRGLDLAGLLHSLAIAELEREENK